MSISYVSNHIMRFFEIHPDGGKDSPVLGYWILEIKWIFSIVLLKFNPGTRENYHSHAFNAFTWFLSGSVTEECVNPDKTLTSRNWFPSIWPKYTPRENMHKVYTRNDKPAWALSIRGPWRNVWTEYNIVADRTTFLKSGGRRQIGYGKSYAIDIFTK